MYTAVVAPPEPHDVGHGYGYNAGRILVVCLDVSVGCQARSLFSFFEGVVSFVPLGGESCTAFKGRDFQA